jgi:hypothetical protein
LLEGQTHAFAETLLAHSHEHSAKSDPAADMSVNGIWFLPCHFFVSKGLVSKRVTAIKRNMFSGDSSS